MSQLIGDNAEVVFRPPFAPGLGPFRIKGVAYRGRLDWVDKNLPGGREALLAALPDAATRQFFEQSFLAATYYDIFPLVSAGVATARLLGRPFLDFLRERASDQASRDLTGVYRLLLKVISNETIAVKLPQLNGMYYDFGRTEVVDSGPGFAEVARHGLPSLLVPYYFAVSCGYNLAAMRFGGALRAEMTALAVRSEGVGAGGVTTCVLRYRMTW